jgi:F0F1-type ATP synthase membrane subunit a
MYSMRISNRSILKKYAFLWITLILFSGSFIGQWYYGFSTGNTWQDNMRDTFENWQSEFLQLIWQVVALTYLWYIGSPQSKEEEERNQEMLEWIMKNIDRQKAEEFMQELEQKYPKK